MASASPFPGQYGQQNVCDCCVRTQQGKASFNAEVLPGVRQREVWVAKCNSHPDYTATHIQQKEVLPCGAVPKHAAMSVSELDLWCSE